jgi:hypothetical protein
MPYMHAGVGICEDVKEEFVHLSPLGYCSQPKEGEDKDLGSL